MKVVATQGPLVVVAHRGDSKTLLAFDLTTAESRKGLAGFTVRITPPGKPPYYLRNNLQFEHPENHAQVADEPANSTANAPLHKFRWVHVPGMFHQELVPALGDYSYAVAPRYFDDQQQLKPIDPNLTASVTIEVRPFSKGKLSLGFTRGFTQSQAFTDHFGLTAKLRPSGNTLEFDLNQVCGKDQDGKPHTFAEMYKWSGFTARERIFGLLDEAIGDPQASVDVFAYDLNEPGIVGKLLTLGQAGRARIILDNSSSHHSADGKKAEDRFAADFISKAGNNSIKRGNFSRFSHDKVFILRRSGVPAKVLTGSTNFSITGLYVNSNHVLLFDDAGVAGLYAQVFEQAWNTDLDSVAFRDSALAKTEHVFGGGGLPAMRINFSPHTMAVARQVLGKLVTRANAEKNQPQGLGNVLFAVMELQGSTDNPVYDALSTLHQDTSLFSFGISDNPEGIELYKVGAATGVIVTGKPVKTRLPPPFNQVRNIGGFGHQIHHKFVVCGANRPSSAVYCGSSNLALLGERDNGDNLLAIEDDDVAMVFAIEALGLIDHFSFLDGIAAGPSATLSPAPPANLTDAAVASGWFLGTTDFWSKKFFDPNDLHSKDRQIFAAP
jgi:hypothetical protein